MGRDFSLVALAAALSLLAVACGGAPSPTPKQVIGTANVAFAGSLELVMDKYVGPAFTKKAGYHYEGRGAGSLGLAQEIRAQEISPNVFISVGAAPLALLEPAYTRWAVRIASSPLVVAYYPEGPHATELRQISQGKLPLKDLFSLMAQPAFRLGRTNPATDPQGEAFAMMVGLASHLYSFPQSEAAADLGGTNPGGQIFAETALEAELQAGQLDAASAFRSEALQLGLPYITLPASIDFGDPQDLVKYRAASLQLTPTKLAHGFLLDIEATVIGKSDRAAAESFVGFLASSSGRAILTKEGYATPSPTLLGDSTAAPPSIRSAVKAG
ncbi:MAG TPA: extracellular solute-binding protein [Candidatus Dormibacteraeota bacterium]|nr:extracellular solute-binding protein [Candidatus Dormibacteraeota bacterium]